MSTFKRSLAALLIAPMALGITMPGSVSAASRGGAGPVSAARAHQPTTIRATLEGQTLHVTGGNFNPGSRVAIAVINTRTWRALFTVSAMTEAATYRCLKGTSVVCGQRDPNAGDLSVEITVQRMTSPRVLAVLFRSGGEVGLGRVYQH
jgi:hypothetical protein